MSIYGQTDHLLKKDQSFAVTKSSHETGGQLLYGVWLENDLKSIWWHGKLTRHHQVVPSSDHRTTWELPSLERLSQRLKTLSRLADRLLDRGLHIKAPGRDHNFHSRFTHQSRDKTMVGEIAALTVAKNLEIRAKRLISAYRDSSLPLIQ